MPRSLCILALLATYCGGFTSAETVHREQVLPARPVVTEGQVADWLRIWQQRLKLTDWRIETKIVRKTELKPDTLGNVKWNLKNKTALIRVMSPTDYDLPESRIADDIECTIVHELLHLRLCELPHDRSNKMAEEDVINPLADALLELHREGRRQKPLAEQALTREAPPIN